MPEGHSVRRLANRFQEWFVGSECELSSPQGRFAQGAARLTGRTMVNAFSVGKHMFLEFVDEDEGADNEEGHGGELPSEPLWLHVHLGLYGAWRFYHRSGEGDVMGAPISPGSFVVGAEDWTPPPPRGAVRVRVATDSAVGDLNGPNQCEVLTAGEVDAVMERLGPDPLDLHSDPDELRAEFVRKVRSSGRAVGELVMDQSVSAGVGNIYRAEALFRQGISPFRKGQNVSAARLGRLWDDFVVLLADGVRDGAIITLRDEDKPEGIVYESVSLSEDEDYVAPLEGALEAEATLDPEGQRWYVYKREGRPCHVCGQPVRGRQVAGRNLFWCATCQR